MARKPSERHQSESQGGLVLAFSAVLSSDALGHLEHDVYRHGTDETRCPERGTLIASVRPYGSCWVPHRHSGQ